MAAAEISIVRFLDLINQYILNPLMGLVFAVAFLVFFYGVFQFINKAGEDTERAKAKSRIIWGLVGMFVMFSAYGLIHLVLVTFQIQNEPGVSSYLKL